MHRTSACPRLALLAAAFAAALAVPRPARAHGPDGHAHKAPHGGLVASVGKYHLELVVTDDGVDLWVLDDKEATLPVADKSGKLVVQVSAGDKKGTQEAAFVAAGPSLHAPLDLAGVQTLVAIATVKLDGKPQSARFSWKRPPTPTAAVRANPASGTNGKVQADGRRPKVGKPAKAAKPPIGP